MTRHSLISMTRALRFLRVLLLVPFLLAQFLAAGTMVQSGPDGPRLVLCSGDGVVEVVLAADGTLHPVDPADHGAGQDNCPWAALLHHGVMADVARAPSAPLAWSAHTVRPMVQTVLPQARHAWPETRGPPQSA